MRVSIFGPASVAFVLAYGLAGSSVSSGARPAPATRAILVVAGTNDYRPSADAQTSIVLFANQFTTGMSAETRVRAVDAGSPDVSLPVDWSMSGDSVEIGNPFGSAEPHSGTEAGIVGRSYGASTLKAVARTGGLTASIRVFYYPTLSIGCAWRFSASASFDPEPGFKTQPFDADVYETAPDTIGNDMNPCFGTPYTFGTRDVTHYPYGAVLLTDGFDANVAPGSNVSRGPEFPFVTAKLWRHAFTSSDDPAFTSASQDCDATGCRVAPRVVLFKTRAGRIVKSITNGGAPIGPYEVSDVEGDFPY